MVIAMSVLGVSGLPAYLAAAFVGAAVTAAAVHLVAAIGRDGATPMKLTIAGAAVTAALTSWTSALLLVDRQTMEVFRFWQVGTVGGRDTGVLLTGLPFLLAGAVLALAGIRGLNSLALGDDVACGLGRRVARDRVVLGLAVVLLAGTATALAGPVGFVGLLAAHGVRGLVGPDHARVLPLSAGVGAGLVVLADTVGRIVLPPTEVQVGIMTAVIGVPAFLWLVRRGRMAGL
jgi:iron complex transport system permease protein